MAIALIVAAGRGERLGAGQPKAFVPLGGRPMIEWSVSSLAAVASIDRVVVALPAGVSAPAGTVGVRGGAVRSESVRAALRAAGPGDPVLVHDAARPLVSVELIERTLAAALRPGVAGAIAAAQVTDTIKRADVQARVVETLDRSTLWSVQTPQVFRRRALEQALEQSSEVLAAATDDAWLVERCGGTIEIVPAPRENIKVTTSVDLRLAELLLAERSA
jgi:2-C-methyl-D-erythritol 4-phosphate cytidylyltransferase